MLCWTPSFSRPLSYSFSVALSLYLLLDVRFYLYCRLSSLFLRFLCAHLTWCKMCEPGFHAILFLACVSRSHAIDSSICCRCMSMIQALCIGLHVQKHAWRHQQLSIGHKRLDNVQRSERNAKNISSVQHKDGVHFLRLVQSSAPGAWKQTKISFTMEKFVCRLCLSPFPVHHAISRMLIQKHWLFQTHWR